MHWAEASTRDLDRIIGLLLASHFPMFDKADDLQAVREILGQAENLVMYDGEKLAGWVGLAHVGGDWWSFDIAVLPEYQKKWDYECSMKEVGKYVFTNLQAKGIVGVCYNPASVKLGLKCGMVISDEEDPHGGVILKLNREEAEGKWF